MVAAVMHSMMTRDAHERPTRDRLCTIRSRLCIAGCLLYTARCRLSLRRRCCRLLRSRVSTSRSLIGLVRGVGGALFRGRLVRRTSREQREG
jgi:hypothetical protein